MNSSTRISPTLMMTEGDTPGRLYELSRPSITLGRNPVHCDIVLNAPEVSRRHARIVKDESGRYAIRDLESKSGTRVNDAAVGPIQTLRDGDLIKIWNFTLKYQSHAVQVQDDPPSHGSTILKARDLLAEDPRRPFGVDLRQKLDALVDISQGLFQSLDLREVLETTLESLFEIFPWANRGFVLLRDEATGELLPKAVKTPVAESGNQMISQTIVNLVMSRGQAILSRDAHDDSRLNYAESIQRGRMRTVMCVPLLDRARKPIGLIQIDTLSIGETFSQEDLDVLVVVSRFVSAAVENAALHTRLVRRAALEAEEDHARRVQRLFLPKSRPRLPSYEFWDCYQPAESVGGDYFGYFALGEEVRHTPDPEAFAGHLAVMIGDVTGKGMPAALIMAKLSSEARVAVTTELDPRRVVERLNTQILQDELDGMFVTFLLAWIDARRHRVQFVRAGHMGPVLRRADGRVEVLGESSGGPPLGLIRNRAYDSFEFRIEPGDMVFLYTDGVTESQDTAGDLFGIDRFCRLISRGTGGVAAIGKAALAAVQDHSRLKGQTDDITLIGFGRPPKV